MLKRLLCVVVFAFGCDDGAGGARAATYEEMTTSVARKACELQRDCCGSTVDVAACAQILAGFMIDSTSPHIESGDAIYNRQCGEALVQDARRVTCDNLDAFEIGAAQASSSTEAACAEGLLVGTKGEGESCQYGEDIEGVVCSPGLICYSSDGDAVCTVPPGNGEPCGYGTAPCDDGLYCEQDACATLKAQDEACQLGQCGEGLFCDEEVCAPRHGEGEACENHECLEGLICNSESHTCEREPFCDL